MKSKHRLLPIVVLCILSVIGCATLTKLQQRDVAGGRPSGDPIVIASQDSSGTFRISPEMAPLLDQLEQIDFSSEIARMQSSDEAGKHCAPLKPDSTVVPVAEMTPNEKKLAFGMAGEVAGWGFASFNLCVVHAYSYLFLADTGRWPSDAKELVAWEWKNDAGWARDILAKPRAEQYGAGLLYFINPVTGRFYDTFQSETWSPGGVNFKELHTEEEIFAAFGDRPGADRIHYPSYRGTWLIEVWGEKPDVKLGSHAVNIEDPNDFDLNPSPPAGEE